ncbi:MAG: hypothetical protein ABSE28_01965 [Candidatus Sulfotelmatobacter sp.]|jgi:hypothetical protein
MKFLRIFQLVLLITCSVLLSQGNLTAQDEQSALPSIRLEVHSADQAAASSSSDYRVHLRLKTASVNRYSPLPTAAAPSLSILRPDKLVSAPVSDAAIPAVPPPGFYPADLSHPFGGPVVTSAESHPIYVDCASSCWGNPARFLTNLGKSNFIHVADQYVGLTTDNRYTVGTAGIISYPILTALSDNDVLQIVHSAASVLGTGYSHIYHIFLPKGVDECFVETTECYSPDNPSTFVFCAYHSSVTFSDIGHVLFTVEPYQNVPGCSMLQPSPNGAIIDSTSSVLGHETFETITDPDPPTGWIAVSSNGVFGEEIGDLCPGVDLTGPYFEDPVSVLNGHKYEIQPMYSNTYHACSFAP